MNHFTLTPRNLLFDKYLDNSPVFFTGLANSQLNTEQERSLHDNFCNKSVNDSIKSSELCNNNTEGSIQSEVVNQNDDGSFSQSIATAIKTPDHQASLSDLKKKPLLPSPDSPCISTVFLLKTLEQVKALSNTTEQVSSNPLTPYQKQEDLKWKSSVKTHLHSKSNVSPYPSRTNESRQSGVKLSSHPSSTTPSTRNGRFPHRSKFHNNEEADFKTPFSTTIPSPNDQLSRQIWKLFHENKQTEEVFRGKMILRDKLHEILREIFPSCGLYVVGSSMTGLGAKSSDIDMCLMLTDCEIDQQKEAVNILHSVKYLFRKYSFLHHVEVIYAKVPILKFVDSVCGIEVDLNINNAIGIRNTQLLSSYARIDKRLPPLVVLVKLWARYQGINDAKNNSLSSYSIVLMVIHFLQYRCQPPVLPCFQQLQPDKFNSNTDVRNLKLHEDLPDFTSENNKDLGDLFLGFLKYFALEFKYRSDVMSIRLGSVIPREHAKHNLSPKNKEAHWKFVCIEEPFDLTNTARSVFKENVFEYVNHVFKNSWNRIHETKDLYSILR